MVPFFFETQRTTRHSAPSILFTTLTTVRGAHTVLWHCWLVMLWTVA